MFLWARAGRLRPMHMVWEARNYNEPKYALVRYHKPRLRQPLRLDWLGGPKVDDDRESRRVFPGKTGEWPWMRKHKPESRL